MIRRAVNRVLDAQTWADGLGDTLANLYLAVLRPMPRVKDLLHGTWLGHALHPALTDFAIGGVTVGIVLDIAARAGARDLAPGANAATLVGLVAMLGSAVTGAADHTGTYGRERRFATIHSLIMYTAAVLYLVSVLSRYGFVAPNTDVAFVTALLGFLLVSAGSYIGGEVVYGLGYMVDRHAWRSGGTKWAALEPATFAEGAPEKAKAGGQPLVVVRRGAALQVLHDTCAHAGCSLAENGKIVGDTIECGCHGSRFELATGRVARGPATYDQPRYEVREEQGRFEVRRATRA
ncbi:MAG TPA: Rieske 2Fe-2S domain-containing protein [Candidatus Limnocylindria bacterium]|nr:Rieske 2Fe-2S domain-containing protein [Candidatus Limnocylindria bacterium]